MDFESIVNRVTELAQGGVAKAKDLAEIAKLKVNNAAEEDAIRKAYAEIGKLYFAQHGLDPDPAFAALCAKIVECKERIAYNEERVADMQQAAGISDADAEAAVTGTEAGLGERVADVAEDIVEKVEEAAQKAEDAINDLVEPKE